MHSPLPAGWNGGLFYEPYVRVDSKLSHFNNASDLDDDISVEMLGKFWEKFKKAVAAKYKRDWEDSGIDEAPNSKETASELRSPLFDHSSNFPDGTASTSDTWGGRQQTSKCINFLKL